MKLSKAQKKLLREIGEAGGLHTGSYTGGDRYARLRGIGLGRKVNWASFGALQDRGLLERISGDWRGSKYRLSDLGEKTLRELSPAVEPEKTLAPVFWVTKRGEVQEFTVKTEGAKEVSIEGYVWTGRGSKSRFPVESAPRDKRTALEQYQKRQEVLLSRLERELKETHLNLSWVFSELKEV